VRKRAPGSLRRHQRRGPTWTAGKPVNGNGFFTDRQQHQDVSSRSSCCSWWRSTGCRWGDTVGRWLPGVVHGNGNDGGKITVRELLQHTSGLQQLHR